MKVTFSILASSHRHVEPCKMYYWMLEPWARFLRGLVDTCDIQSTVHVQVPQCSCSVEGIQLYVTGEEPEVLSSRYVCMYLDLVYL